MGTDGGQNRAVCCWLPLSVTRKIVPVGRLVKRSLGWRRKERQLILSGMRDIENVSVFDFLIAVMILMMKLRSGL